MKTVIRFLDDYVNYTGYVTDSLFENITKTLIKFGNVILEDEQPGLVETVYEVGSRQYKLTYQTRKPDSPRGRDLAYIFTGHE